ncbi:uncharacterized protein [Procambarus clarkii]|uniref:uncharacterized protein isoform X2 n=1 Tax=Procambarus clarkii TaxID=6728 RepID=UPI0037424035
MADVGDQTLGIYFTYTHPMYRGQKADGSVNTVAISLITVGVIYYLAALFPSKSSRFSRSIQEDQLDLFQQIESNIATLGVDGHACVLRFICEMQTNRFSSSSIFGEIFNLMFTPKQGSNYKILEDYIAAEMAGQDSGPGQTCAETYPSCPVSVFAVLRRFQNQMGFSTPEDKPLNASINLQNSLLTGDIDP